MCVCIYTFIHTHTFVYTTHSCETEQELSFESFPAEKPEKLNIKFRLAKEGEVEEGERDGTTFHLLLEPGSEGTDTKDKRPQEEESSAPSDHCSASQDGHQPACGEEPNHKPEADP